jgi:hypothetical protein
MPRIDIPIRSEADPLAYGFSLVPEMGEAASAFSLAVYTHLAFSVREIEGARYRTALINGCTGCQNFRIQRDLPDLMKRAGRHDAPAAALSDATPPDEAFYESVVTGSRLPG